MVSTVVVLKRVVELPQPHRRCRGGSRGLLLKLRVTSVTRTGAPPMWLRKLDHSLEHHHHYGQRYHVSQFRVQSSEFGTVNCKRTHTHSRHVRIAQCHSDRTTPMWLRKLDHSLEHHHCRHHCGTEVSRVTVQSSEFRVRNCEL